MPWWRRGFEIDLRSLALFRIALGAIMLGDLLDRARDLGAFYTEAGVMPAAARAEIDGVFAYLSLHRYAMGSAWAQGVLFVVAGLVAASLIAGWRSRVTAAAAWLLTLSLHRVNPDVGGGGDALLHILLFWSVLVPTGARWSFDARRGASVRGGSNTYVAWPGAALLLQVAMVYWFTAAMKSGATWRDGSALGVALWNDSLTTPAGAALLAYPGLLRVMTWGTLALEWLGPVLALLPVWRGPARLIAVAVFVGFHIGIEVTMTVGLFSFASIAAWTVFIPRCVWDRRGAGAAPPGAPAIATSRFTSAGAGIALAYVALVNLSQLPIPGAARLHGPPLSLLGHALMLDQRWSMFAPDPRDQYGWFVVEGKLADGRRVDCFRAGRPVSWAKPASVSGEFPTMRWRIAMMNLGIPEPGQVKRLEPMVWYFARRWNADHAGGERVERIALWVVIADYQRRDAEPGRLLLCELDVASDRAVYVQPAATPGP
ncbi:MAG: HTTM domain-containing protein [Phycisphaerales bacterium]